MSSNSTGRSHFAICLSVGLVLMGGCGGAAELPAPVRPSAPSVPSGPSLVRKKPPGGIHISGTLGTIPPRKVQSTLERRLPAFQRCFLGEIRDVDTLFGAVNFSFAVAADGDVESVFLSKSTVGNRDAELCLLKIARKTHFPRPRGGDRAELSWGFTLDAPEGVRPPVLMDGARVAVELPELLTALTECGVGRSSVTAYVQPGGVAVSVGLAGSSALQTIGADCVVQTVQSNGLPNPGSYIGKVTFSVP